MEISTIRARSTAERGHRRSRIAFVTVGASASFKSLIDEVISEPFLAKLRALHFSQLIVQCGPDYDYFESARPKLGANDPEGLDVSGFAYTKDLKQFFALAAADPEAEMRSRGLIITHAGSGSILEALNFDSTIIAVPNPTLMGNHQEEIAKEMDKKGFCTHGELGSLAEILTEDLLNKSKTKWPPSPDPASAYPGGLYQVIDILMPMRIV
ncbi:glycosyltransferase family 1 protein [Hypomontagnella submonticulosa]|nr:glycosyltransferase family 1 protein [Hypomontagnella submonticulosa]